MRIAITGASGFVGRNLLPVLEAEYGTVVALSRQPLATAREWRSSPTLDARTDPAAWTRVLTGIDVVVHAAARAHVMRDDAADPLDAFRRVNRDGAVAMARGAAAAGVRRIVFVSTVKVLGENTDGRGPFGHDDRPVPVDPYAISKREAEVALAQVAQTHGIELVILRPPLVYGPGVAGNVAMLRRLVRRGMWLPLGLADDNRRSMISTANLAGAIRAAIEAPAAAGGAWLVSDGDDLSTTRLLRALAAAEGRRARLVPVPAGLVRRALALAGRGTMGQRLFGSLAVDIGATTAALDWRPQQTVKQAMADMARDGSGTAVDTGRNGRTSRGVRRVLDLVVAALALPFVVPLCLLVMLAIRIDSAGSPLFVQERVGRGQRPFRLFKLRTMAVDTGDVPSHEVSVSKVTRLGRILRRVKLDELPQLWNVLVGDMAFVGPRPCLPTQHRLIAARAGHGLFAVRPGITGPAQVAGIDMSDPDALATVEAAYFGRASLLDDARIVVRTAIGGGAGDVVGRR